MLPREAEDRVSGTALRYLHWPGRVAVSDEQAWFIADLKGRRKARIKMTMVVVAVATAKFTSRV